MGLEDIDIKVMYHLIGVFLKTNLINIQVQQVNLCQEQNRGIVHDNTDNLITIVGFLVFGLGDGLKRTKDSGSHVIDDVEVDEDDSAAH